MKFDGAIFKLIIVSEVATIKIYTRRDLSACIFLWDIIILRFMRVQVFPLFIQRSFLLNL